MSYEKDKGGFPRTPDHGKLQSTVEHGDKERLVRKYFFWCPGCKELHWFAVRKPDDREQFPVWSFNKDPDNPTFSPSLLRTGPGRCHLFLKNGKLEFLNDCMHDLKGQTVPLPDLPDWMFYKEDDDG